MNKILLIIAMFLILPIICVADGIYRDKDGKYAGMWRGNDVHREYFGPDGSYRGSAERSGDGWTFKDSRGGHTGSSSGPSDRNPFINDND